MAPYSYRPLQDGQFRLVEIIPGRGHLNIRLHERKLEQASPFSFLSYAWGNAFDLHSLECDGNQMRIREHLRNFLLEFRRRHQGYLLFIGEISINQEDINEKVLQLQMLPQINRKAMSTFCWVDAPEPDRVSRLIANLCWISRLTPLSNYFLPYRNHDPCRSGSKITSEQLGLFQSETEDVGPELWEALNTFLGDKYFQRIWITLDWYWSKDLRFMCRGITISWDELCLALGACFRFSFRNRLTSIGFFNLLVMDLVRKRYLLHQVRPTLYEILSTWHSCRFDAVDLKDKLFAPLNIVQEGYGHNGIAVDYSKTMEESYLRAASALGVLSLSLAKGPSLTLPTTSWVPDWNATRDHLLLSQSDTRFTGSPEIQPDVFTDLPRRALQCRGIVADRIKKTCSWLPPRRPCDHYILGGNSTLFDEWFEFAKGHARRSKRSPYDETKLLFQFAETIQARGANTIWETEWDESSISNRMRNFLEFLNEEEEDAAVTLETRLFYAACFPSHGHRFGITERGYYCLLPQEAKPADLVCIIYGNNVPILLRQHTSHYQNLGECYVNGLMHYDATVLGDCQEFMFIIM